MKKKIVRITSLLLLIFIFLFGLKSAYEISNIKPQKSENYDPISSIQNNSLNSLQNNISPRMVQNYASTKTVISFKDTTKTVVIDQKYEKVGFISSSTVNFDSDLIRIKDVIKSQKAVTQQEELTGEKKDTALVLTIGVHPDRFDALISELKKIGDLKSFKVVKTDKTSEYKDLLAKTETQKKYIQSLKALKEKSGSIAEMMELEAKILGVEETLQSYGVQLRDYSSDNELCTVKMTISKATKVKSPYTIGSVTKSVFKSFEWTVWTFAGILTVTGLCILISLGGILVFGKGIDLYKKFGNKDGRVK